MIRIRKAKESDTPQLEELFLVTRQETFSWEHPDTFKIEDYKKSTEGEVVFVAEEDGEIMGFLSIYPQDSFIHSLFIRSDQQNRGIGKLLLKQAIEQFPHPLTLKVVINNKKACQFYDKQGWKILSTHEDAPEPYHLYGYD